MKKQEYKNKNEKRGMKIRLFLHSHFYVSAFIFPLLYSCFFILSFVFFSFISKIFNEIKGALTDGYKEFVGFKVLTPEQQKKKQEQEAKTKAKAENIKMSYSKQQEAKATAMAAIREDLAKKAETHGVIGMSHDQQNELLGRGWNQSHEGEKSWYHIAAIGARIQEKRAEELRAAKAQKTAAAGKGEKKNWFLDKNTAHSRVGGNYQSAPS